jgi:hypothetical protein
MRFAVSPEELASLAAAMRRSADEMDTLRHHQGPIHGKAADGGHPVFRAAVDDFAARWMWGIEVLQGDVDVLADLLAKVAEAYAGLESEIAQTWPTAGTGMRR